MYSGYCEDIKLYFWKQYTIGKLSLDIDWFIEAGSWFHCNIESLGDTIIVVNQGLIWRILIIQDLKGTSPKRNQRHYFQVTWHLLQCTVASLSSDCFVDMFKFRFWTISWLEIVSVSWSHCSGVGLVVVNSLVENMNFWQLNRDIQIHSSRTQHSFSLVVFVDDILTFFQNLGVGLQNHRCLYSVDFSETLIPLLVILNILYDFSSWYESRCLR